MGKIFQVVRITTIAFFTVILILILVYIGQTIIFPRKQSRRGYEPNSGDLIRRAWELDKEMRARENRLLIRYGPPHDNRPDFPTPDFPTPDFPPPDFPPPNFRYST